MAIEAKATLLNEMERALATEISAAERDRILAILTEALDGYDLTIVQQDGIRQDDLLDAYLSALAIEGRSAKTIERYRYLIGRMMAAVRTPTRKITVYHLRKYLSDEKARGISDRTLESTRQVFSAYFNWLQRERLIDQNPTANLGAIKYQKKEKDIYSDVDLERMKFGCKSLRDRAVVAFLRATGCRIRTDDHPALFVGKGTDRMKPGGIRKMLVDLGTSSHVTHVHPHKFRRTTATNMIRHGMPIQEVAAILGHDKLDTTMQYVVLDKSDIKNSYRKYA